MTFNDLSPHSKKATAKTLLAISELCNSLVLHDLASDDPEILTGLSLDDAKNGQSLIEALRALNNDKSDEEGDGEEIVPPNNSPEEAVAESTPEKDTDYTEPEDEVVSSEWETVRQTEPVENTSQPLPFDQEIQEVDPEERDQTSTQDQGETMMRLRDEGLPFDPLVFKGKKNSMFLGVTDDHEEIVWDLVSDPNLIILGDTIGKESTVGKLIADYAFNNKQDVELRIVNPKLGNTEYLNYRTGDKCVASTVEEAFKAIREAKELMSARYQEYDARNGVALESVKENQPRVILWLEEPNAYLPADNDTDAIRDKKHETLENLHSLLQSGHEAKIHVVLKSSANINYELKLLIDGIEAQQAIYDRGFFTAYSNDSVRNNQVELPSENFTAYAWMQFPNDSKHTVLTKRREQVNMVYLMNSHRTSK